MSAASPRPFSGSPSSGDNAWPGHRTAAASASVQSAVERSRDSGVTGGRLLFAAAPPRAG